MLNIIQKTFTSLQATASYEMGLFNLGLKQYPTAIQYFTQAIEHDAKYADAFYQRSIAFKEIGEQQKATADLQKAVELNPKFLNDMLTSAMSDIDFKLYQSAIEKFDFILRTNVKLYKVFARRALAKYAQGKYKEAIKDFDEAIKLKPEENTYCERGNAKAKLGFYEEAMADYQQALQLNPKSTYALLNRGITTYQLSGRYHQALTDFRILPPSGLYCASALYHYGLVKFELGDFQEAGLALDRLFEIEETNANAYILSGAVRLITDSEGAADEFVHARELIGDSIAFDPSDVKTKIVWFERVGVEWIKHYLVTNYNSLDEFKESIKENINAASEPNLVASAYYHLACAYHIDSEFSKAEETFLQSIKLEENSRVNYEYANLLIKQKKIALAISKLQRAIELSTDGKCITYYNLLSTLLLNQELKNELEKIPRLSIRVSVLATWQLINCYIAAGEKSNAEQQLNNLLKAVEEFPTPLAYSLLGYAYRAFKQWAMAARSFKTAVLLRANYSLAQENLQECLNQLSVQEDEIEPFEIIAQVQQLLVSQNSEPGKQEQESTVRSTASPQLSDNNKQEIDKQAATERSKLNPKQHVSYESMRNRTSSEANFVNEVKSSTYQEIYLLTSSHKSGGQLLKLPMEEFVGTKEQKSSEQKSETETPLPPVPNLPNTAKEEDKKEPDNAQGNRLQL